MLFANLWAQHGKNQHDDNDKSDNSSTVTETATACKTSVTKTIRSSENRVRFGETRSATEDHNLDVNFESIARNNQDISDLHDKINFIDKKIPIKQTSIDSSLVSKKYFNDSDDSIFPNKKENVINIEYSSTSERTNKSPIHIEENLTTSNVSDGNKTIIHKYKVTKEIDDDPTTSSHTRSIFPKRKFFNNHKKEILLNDDNKSSSSIFTSFRKNKNNNDNKLAIIKINKLTENTSFDSMSSPEDSPVEELKLTTDSPHKSSYFSNTSSSVKRLFSKFKKQ